MSKVDQKTINWINKNGSIYLKRLLTGGFIFKNQYKKEFSEIIKKEFDEKNDQYEIDFYMVKNSEIETNPLCMEPTEQDFKDLDYLKDFLPTLETCKDCMLKTELLQQRRDKLVQIFVGIGFTYCDIVLLCGITKLRK